MSLNRLIPINRLDSIEFTNGVQQILQDGKIDIATHIFKNIVKSKKLEQETLITKICDLGLDYSNQMNYELAEKFYLVANNIEEGNYGILCSLSYTLLMQAKYTKAHNYLNEVLQLQPSNVQALELKGYILLLEENDKSYSYFQQALEIEPNNLELIAQKGLAALFLNNDEDADLHFTFALGMAYQTDEQAGSETFLYAKIGMALLLYKQSDFLMAEEMIDDVMQEVNSQRAALHEAMLLLFIGLCRLKLNTQANALLPKLRKEFPDSQAVRYHTKTLKPNTLSKIKIEFSQTNNSQQPNESKAILSTEANTRLKTALSNIIIHKESKQGKENKFTSMNVPFLVSLSNRSNTTKRVNAIIKDVESMYQEKINDLNAKTSTDVRKNLQLTLQCHWQSQMILLLSEQIEEIEKITAANIFRFNVLIDQHTNKKDSILKKVVGTFFSKQSKNTENNKDHADLRLEYLKLKLHNDSLLTNNRHLKKRIEKIEERYSAVKQNVVESSRRSEQVENHIRKLEIKNATLFQHWVDIGNPNEFKNNNKKNDSYISHSLKIKENENDYLQKSNEDLSRKISTLEDKIRFLEDENNMLIAQYNSIIDFANNSLPIDERFVSLSRSIYNDPNDTHYNSSSALVSKKI